VTAPPGPGPAAQTLRLAARAYLRYAIPLTLLAAVALAPWLALGLGASTPKDVAGARGALRMAWLLGATAWIGQLWLVGAAAPLVRALDEGAPLSQLRAIGRGALQLARGALPWLAAVAAIALGGLALALPGLALLVLFSTAAAGTRRGLPAPLLESAELVRRGLPLAAGAIAALLAVDVGAVALAQQLLRPEVAKKLRPDQLEAYRRIVQIAALAVLVAAPPIAALLAAVHTRAARDLPRA
jgi:hypothetical protein